MKITDQSEIRERLLRSAGLALDFRELIAELDEESAIAALLERR